MPTPQAYGVIQEQTPQPDYITDEGVLIYQSERGLIIITGRKHRGIENIVRHCQNITGITGIYALIGGFHLRAASPQKLWKTRRFLRQQKPEKVARLSLHRFVGTFLAARNRRASNGRCDCSG